MRLDTLFGRSPLARCAAVGTALALPLALGILIAAGLTPGRYVGVGFVATFWALLSVFLAAGLLPAARSIQSAAAFARRLAEGETAELPPRGMLLPFLGAPLERALRRLEREWRRQRERSGRAARARGDALDALPDPVLVLDASHEVIFANAAAEAALGGPLADRPLEAAIRAPALLSAAARLAESGGAGPVSARFALASETGGQRVWAARLQRTGGAEEGGEGAETVLSLRDLTDSERDERMRTDFVANASHEIRTPLTALIGATETFRSTPPEDTKTRESFFAMMESNAERIRRLIEDLLSLSRLERAEGAPPAAAASPARAAERAAAALAWVAGRRNARIALEVTGAPDAVGDADELTRAFQNLIANALNHGPSGAAVRVTAAWDDATVTVAVSDEGPGIAAEHIPRLTERFYRVDRARAAGGAGLGLAIVKHIVRRHRGALDIESEVGKGSRFAVRLPRARGPGDGAAKPGDGATKM